MSWYWWIPGLRHIGRRDAEFFLIEGGGKELSLRISRVRRSLKLLRRQPALWREDASYLKGLLDFAIPYWRACREVAREEQVDRARAR